MNRDILSCSNVTNIDFLFLVRNGHKADNYGIGKQKITQVFAFVVLKPTQGPSRVVPKPGRTAKKAWFSHTALDCRHVSSPHRARTTTKLGKMYAPLSVESSLPSLRAVRGLRLEVSLGTWGPGPFLYQLFAIQNSRSPIGTI